MRINELVNEAGEFSRYRQLGQHPTQLATHLAKQAVGGVTGNDTPTPKSKNNLGNTSEIKTILDNVIAGKPLDSQSLQALKQFRRKL
jgi:hypothetical protein